MKILRPPRWQVGAAAVPRPADLPGSVRSYPYLNDGARHRREPSSARRGARWHC
jgi:hypothetical protein